MDVLSPLPSTATAVRPLAARRRDLRNCRIGILDNSKPNADVLLGRVADLLAERHGTGPVRRWRKPGSSRPASVIDEVVAASDVVLTGSAD
jgi:hypothetical protein